MDDQHQAERPYRLHRCQFEKEPGKSSRLKKVNSVCLRLQLAPENAKISGVAKGGKCKQCLRTAILEEPIDR